MKKILALILALCMVIGVTGCSNTEVATQSTSTQVASEETTTTEPLALKLGTTGPAPGDDAYITSTYFADALAEVSDGMMTVEVIASGALGDTAQHYAQLREGTLDIFTTALDTGTTMIGGDDFAVTVVPYLFEDLDHYETFLESDILNEMMDSVSEANNLRYLGPIGFRFPRGLSSTFPIASVEDVQNLKIRVPDTASMVKIWEAWGANPQVIGSSELYTALQGQLVDAQENDLKTSYNNQWMEVTPYYMEIEYIQQSCIIYVSGTTWGELTEDQQNWLTEATQLAHNNYNNDFADAYDDLKEEAIANGVEFVDVDVDSFRTAAAEAAKELDGELWSAGLYDQITELAN